MNENIEKVLAALDGFRMSDEMTYSAYSVLYDEISLLDDLLKAQEPKKLRCIRRLTKVMKGICPVCEMEIESVIHGRITKFCKFCGQAVKWE